MGGTGTGGKRVADWTTIGEGAELGTLWAAESAHPPASPRQPLAVGLRFPRATSLKG